MCKFLRCREQSKNLYMIFAHDMRWLTVKLCEGLIGSIILPKPGCPYPARLRDSCRTYQIAGYRTWAGTVNDTPCGPIPMFDQRQVGAESRVDIAGVIADYPYIACRDRRYPPYMVRCSLDWTGYYTPRLPIPVFDQRRVWSMRTANIGGVTNRPDVIGRDGSHSTQRVARQSRTSTSNDAPTTPIPVFNQRLNIVCASTRPNCPDVIPGKSNHSIQRTNARTGYNAPLSAVPVFDKRLIPVRT